MSLSEEEYKLYCDYDNERMCKLLKQIDDDMKKAEKEIGQMKNKINHLDKEFIELLKF